MKHKIILNKLSYLLLGLVFITFFVSCDQVESEPDSSPILIEDITGSWYIIGLEADGETPAYNGDYVKFDIYNTSENNSDFWMDDHGDFFEIKSKATIDLSSLTFSSEANTEELYSEGTVTISNGVITKNSFTTTGSGTTVDAINFEAEFSWDPGTTYLFKGHKRTAFPEDENPHYSN
ncbi:hypothetical protein GCM10022291_20230 [Postechiella marina]|uniref:Lipid-binding hydrolase n=1 Tax=Postechiella marina TaxID=943941 RepID=A0ABP8CA25_9FLAO